MRWCFVFMLLTSSWCVLAANRYNPIQEILVFHPNWISKTVTSHDFWGGNGDGQFFGGKETLYNGEKFKVIFHERGEGSVQRFLISALPEKIEQDFVSLVILVDGIELFNGDFKEFFNANPLAEYPVVYDIRLSSGSFVSYLPIPYQREIQILVKANPHFYQVTYREGKGSSQTMTTAQLMNFMTDEWWAGSRQLEQSVALKKGNNRMVTGPLTVSRLSVRLNSPEQVGDLFVSINGQKIPLAFFFGLGVTSGSELDQDEVRSSLNYVDPKNLLFLSRMPIPLRKGESLQLISEHGANIRVGIETTDLKEGVRFAPQYHDQWGEGFFSTMTLFENSRPTQLLSTVMNITDGKVGDQYFLEGEEMIRVDGLSHPYELGTGTEEYFGGGWYFWSTFSNFFSGLPRRIPAHFGGEEWKSKPLEHSLYRQHTIDPIVGRKGIRFGWEAGGMGQYQPIRYRTLVNAYEFEGWKQLSTVAVDIKGDRNVYTWRDGERNLNQNPLRLYYRFIEKGQTSFEVKCPRNSRAVLLERTYDGGLIDQHGDVYINGRLTGTFFNGYANTARRFAEDSLWIDLESLDCRNGKLLFQIDVRNWTESSYRAIFF